VPHQPFGLPPCVSKRRLVALSRCPDADCILPAAAIGWNGTKVWNVINRGARGFPKRTRWVRLRNSQAKTDPGYGPEVPPFARRGIGHLQFFPLPCGNSQAWFGQVGIPRSSLRSLTADEIATDAISDGGTERDSNVPEFLEIGQGARILRYVPLLKLCALLPKSTLSSGCRTFTHAGNK